MKRTPIAMLAAVLLLPGCAGDGDDDSGSESGADGGVPACADVWVKGETLDLETYDGCMEDDNIIVVVTRGCYRDGKYVGQFTTFEDRLWVIQKGTDPKTGSGGIPGKITDVNPGC